MSKTTLKNDQWEKILTFLRQQPHVYVGNEAKCHRFVEAVLWIMRTGAQWRELPQERGNWNSVYKRFARWSDKGVWKEMHEHFAADPDMESVIIDSTVVRAHACAAGAPKKTMSQKNKLWAVAEVDTRRKSMSMLTHWEIPCVSS